MTLELKTYVQLSSSLTNTNWQTFEKISRGTRSYIKHWKRKLPNMLQMGNFTSHMLKHWVLNIKTKDNKVPIK